LRTTVLDFALAEESMLQEESQRRSLAIRFYAPTER
jgi:hypothetical protein